MVGGDERRPGSRPDGSKLAFVVKTPAGNAAVWIAAASGQERPQELAIATDVDMVHWGASSDELLVSASWDGRRSPTLRRVSVQTAESTPVEPAIRFGNLGLGGFDASRDGRVVITLFEEDRGDIWLLDAAPGTY